MWIRARSPDSSHMRICRLYPVRAGGKDEFAPPLAAGAVEHVSDLHASALLRPKQGAATDIHAIFRAEHSDCDFERELGLDSPGSTSGK
jgi:hypothetical protein